MTCQHHTKESDHIEAWAARVAGAKVELETERLAGRLRDEDAESTVDLRRVLDLLQIKIESVAK